ncbi:unnamed protein product [Chironomus riparius]|uniref:MYND-type domain-containing protein n=1 Tax=Chironomus riparius TaxID=315576 RepID=A0A9N9RJE6_9DIPT|nr:unnamed protein product [Chironomus riparius]
MSDLTIVEIADVSLNINKPDLILEENNKRKLTSDDELVDSMAEKKICRDTENFDDSMLVESTIEESIIDESQLIDDDNDVIEKNRIDNKENDVVESINQDSSSIIEDETREQHTINETSSEEDDDENYDNSVMKKAINALPKPLLLTENDEPIALDDSESECSENIEEINEEQVEEDDSLLSLHKRMMRYNPKFYFARGLVKKSIRIILRKTKRNIKNTKKLFKKYDSDLKASNPQETEVNDKNAEEKIFNGNKGSTLDLNIDQKMKNDKNDAENKIQHDVEVEDKNKGINNKSESPNVLEIKSLLNDISTSSVDEIISRYIICSSDNNSILSVDDFSEQLFFCLQENKREIDNIQRIWNEKVHLKFKMREIMERLRRQRVISEIETFGIKPSHDVQQFNLLSSKSSTTNSTENEHFERSSKLSSQSVNRLIQDVRENVLKKEKHKINDIVSNMNENYEECTSFGINSNIFQSSLNQGRQGQTVDVQSIINDFRQKNPQEIPRRGRRMKSSFPNNYFMSNQIQTQYTKEDDNKINNSPHDHNSAKSNTSVGFPEVSLLPVNSYYKTHSPQYGQKSSLLQSILTKQPNKSTQSSKSSTLARLLTAPEKSFQNSSRSGIQQNSKVHNNGEITITPIAGSSRRHIIDDEENSEPPLIIDESDDFDLSDRHNTSASDLLCQGCRRNKALFMCAGCSRQWYCSKECQELAWDDHAESCMV